MTESEWLTCEEPRTMLEFLAGKVSDRKLRLFACNCCRHFWTSLDEEGRHVVQVAESFADGLATGLQLKRARDISEVVREPTSGWGGKQACAGFAADRSAWRAAEGAARASSVIFSTARDLAAKKANRSNKQEDRDVTQAIADREKNSTTRVQISLLHDIFGNPFRPILLDSAWITSTVTALANQIYDSRDFSAMPILADAFQDVGCDNPDILDHCRGSGTHVRGCWLVDLIMGRS